MDKNTRQRQVKVSLCRFIQSGSTPFVLSHASDERKETGVHLQREREKAGLAGIAISALRPQKPFAQQTFFRGRIHPPVYSNKNTSARKTRRLAKGGPHEKEMMLQSCAVCAKYACQTWVGLRQLSGKSMVDSRKRQNKERLVDRLVFSVQICSQIRAKVWMVEPLWCTFKSSVHFGLTNHQLFLAMFSDTFVNNKQTQKEDRPF